MQLNSQICNIFFSKFERNKLLTTHGLPENNIAFWNYKSNEISLDGELNGHDDRILFANLSPNENFLATAAGDEVIKIWKAFDYNRPDIIKENLLASFKLR